MSQEISKDIKRTDVEKSVDQQKKPSPFSTRSNPLMFNPFMNSAFFSFRYSYQEMSSANGKTHVRKQQIRYEDGKLSSENFEGTTDADVYQQAVQNMQQLAADSMNIFFNSFTSMLPGNYRPDDKD